MDSDLDEILLHPAHVQHSFHDEALARMQNSIAWNRSSGQFGAGDF
jgi:hypothetical protein